MGTGGYHYYIFQKVDNEYEQMPFFIQGYLDAIHQNSGYYDLEFNMGSEAFFENDIATGEPTRVHKTIHIVVKWKKGVFAFDQVTKCTKYYEDSDTLLRIHEYDEKYNDLAYWRFINRSD